MPVFVSIKPSYLEALQALGYSESEARFLYLVATHSGYFVARQFLFFTCGHWAYPRSDALNPVLWTRKKEESCRSIRLLVCAPLKSLRRILPVIRHHHE